MQAGKSRYIFIYNIVKQMTSGQKTMVITIFDVSIKALYISLLTI